MVDGNRTSKAYDGLISLDDGQFDEAYEVVIAGFGYAGGIAAIEAADRGCRVLLLEKMPDPGGMSVVSGGGIRTALDVDRVFEYLRHTNDGRTPDDVLRVLAEGMATAEDYLRPLVGRVPGAVIEAAGGLGGKGGNYPFPGWDAFSHLLVSGGPNFECQMVYPNVRTRPSSRGADLFWVIEQNVAQRDIDVRLNTAVSRLIRSAEGCIRGVVLDGPDGKRRVKARRGVILATGGFENDPEMKHQYFQARPVLPAASRGNTGDGIRMAQSAGASLWHMWHFHGCYAFRHTDPDFPFALRVKRLPDWNPLNKNKVTVPMVWILVDQDGRRFMNECPPYAQDTSHRPMAYVDTERMRYPRIPAFLIADEAGRATYQLGDARTNDRDHAYDWSPDNTKEIQLGILQQAPTIRELAKMAGLDADALERTVDQWNDMCRGGCDEEFGRPYGTMMPIAKPPFVFGEVWPAVSNTQGGPVHNAKQQILNVAGQPIERLYAAGELGSSFGHLYLSGGNIAECIVTGRVAGSEAAALTPWEAETVLTA